MTQKIKTMNNKINKIIFKINKITKTIFKTKIKTNNNNFKIMECLRNNKICYNNSNFNININNNNINNKI